jgi:cytoskeletal protein CcmA (bactofilin family)
LKLKHGTIGDADTVLAAGSKLEGTLVVPGLLRIEGDLDGSVRAGGGVIVGPVSSVRGDIGAAFAVISGRVEGNLLVRESLRILKGATVLGDMDAHLAEVDEDCLISGNLRIDGGGSDHDPRRRRS